MFAGGNKVAALFELVIGVELCYFSFMLGLHSELALKGFVRNYLRRIMNQGKIGNYTAEQSNGEYLSQQETTQENSMQSNSVPNVSSNQRDSSMIGSISRASLENHLEQIQRALSDRRNRESDRRRSSVSSDFLGYTAYQLSFLIERVGRKTFADERYKVGQEHGKEANQRQTPPQQVTKSAQAENDQRFSNKLILVVGFLFFGNVIVMECTQFVYMFW